MLPGLLGPVAWKSFSWSCPWVLWVLRACKIETCKRGNAFWSFEDRSSCHSFFFQMPFAAHYCLLNQGFQRFNYSSSLVVSKCLEHQLNHLRIWGALLSRRILLPWRVGGSLRLYVLARSRRISWFCFQCQKRQVHGHRDGVGVETCADLEILEPAAVMVVLMQ